jgi:biopolymer transport protein TolR
MGAAAGGSNGGYTRRGSRRKSFSPMSDINVTPMVDVMLVLLVVFMITAPMLATGVAVNLPKTRAEQMPTENERPLVVTVDKTGQIFVGMQDQPVEAASLGATLQAIARDRLDKRVYVRADEGVNYGRVMEVLSLLQGAGFSQVGLPVDPSAMNRLQKQERE